MERGLRAAGVERQPADERMTRNLNIYGQSLTLAAHPRAEVLGTNSDQPSDSKGRQIACRDGVSLPVAQPQMKPYWRKLRTANPAGVGP